VFSHLFTKFFEVVAHLYAVGIDYKEVKEFILLSVNQFIIGCQSICVSCMKLKKPDKRTEDLDYNLGRTILNFPIVGIGASAGGLEALQEFFKNLIPKPDAAFVIIQHLSPDYKSFMSELLSRFTTIEIEVVTDGMALQANHIYLIPPKMNMTIFHGVLYLNELGASRTFNLPIDIFFR
jgi:chemotaxis response regulator CheB